MILRRGSKYLKTTSIMKGDKLARRMGRELILPYLLVLGTSLQEKKGRWSLFSQSAHSHTGNTRGMPPRIGLEPSRCAFSLRKSCSSPLPSFQEVTVAPNRWTVTEPPVGRVPWTWSPQMLTVGWGREGLTPMADGLWLRFIVLDSIELSRYNCYSIVLCRRECDAMKICTLGTRT